MPNLVSTYTTPLTPEEEYLLSLDAVAAEPVPPPPADPATYTAPTTDAAQGYAIPPPAETAPPPAAQEPVPTPAAQYGTAAATGDPFAAYQPAPATYAPTQTTDAAMGYAAPANTDVPWNPGPEVLHPPPRFLSEPANDYAPPDSSLMDTRSLTERVSQETPFRGIEQAPYIPPPPPSVAERVAANQRQQLDAATPAPFRGIEQAPYPPLPAAPSDPAATIGWNDLLTSDEGVSWNALLDPSSWLPEPQRVYDAQGNEIRGMGEAAFIAGPPIVDRAFRAKGPRTSPASGGPAITPRNRVPAARTSEPIPAPVAAQEGPGLLDLLNMFRYGDDLAAAKPIPDPGVPPEPGMTWIPPGTQAGGSTGVWVKSFDSPIGEGRPVRNVIPEPVAAPAPGSQTFPRLAGKPGTPAGGGAYWGPGGRIVYPRGPSVPTEPVISLPAETIPPLPAAPPPRATTGRPVFGQVAGEVIPEPVVTGRPVLGEAGAGIGGRSAPRGRTVPARQPAPETASTANAPTAETVPPPEAPAAPVVAATRGARPTISRRNAALLAAGAVGGGVALANRFSGGDAPAVLPDETRAARAPLEPGIYSPSTNPQTPDEWNGATTRALELLKSTSPADWGAGTKRSAVEINGVPQKLIESRDVPGLYVGYVDVNGNVVPVGSDVSPEAFQDMVVANAAEAPEGWGDTAATPDGGTIIYDGRNDVGGLTPVKTGGATLADATIPAPAGTGDGSSRSSGGGGSSRSSGSGRSSGGSSGRDYGGDDFSRGYEREFTADDFMDAAGGNRRKAEFMARAANRRRKRGKSSGFSGGMGGFWDGFPFNRPPSDIRTLVLNAIAESQAEGRARKQQR